MRFDEANKNVLAQKLKRFCLKSLIVYESKSKIKVRSNWILFSVLFKSGVICEHGLVYENKVRKYLQCYSVG